MKNHFKLLLIFLAIISTSISCSKEEDRVLRLGVGASKSFIVSSELRWNETEVGIESGEIYSFSATGTWTDLDSVTDADGYSSAALDPFNALKRDTSALWFELIASIDTTTLYSVGSTNTITFNETGMLTFFANDAEGFYGNNMGSITTTIMRIQ